MLPGRLCPFEYSINYSNKKFNQDCIMMNPSLISAKLDEISLFGIFDGNGHHGKGIAQAFKNYVLDYFKNGNEMKVTLKKDNFYSIMYNSFVNAQNYLINNSTKLNINLKYSGSTGIVLLFPHNNSNKIYCANVGRNKCMFYTNYGTIKLSYELFPHRASERFRISHFLTQKKIKDKEKEEQNLNLNLNNNNNSDSFDTNNKSLINKLVEIKEKYNKLMNEKYELEKEKNIKKNKVKKLKRTH